MEEEKEAKPPGLDMEFSASVRRALTRPQDVILPPAVRRLLDSLVALLEERQGDR